MQHVMRPPQPYMKQIKLHPSGCQQWSSQVHPHFVHVHTCNILFWTREDVALSCSSRVWPLLKKQTMFVTRRAITVARGNLYSPASVVLLSLCFRSSVVYVIARSLDYLVERTATADYVVDGSRLRGSGNMYMASGKGGAC